MVEIINLEEKSYQEAYELAQVMDGKYPGEYDWQSKVELLQAKTMLAMKYSQSIEALKQNDFAKAKKMLSEVIALDPDYDEQVSCYFYWADTGEDPLEVKNRLSQETDGREIVDKKEPSWLSIFQKDSESIVGHGIKRGLTAVEAAILMGMPLDKVLSMIMISSIKRGLVTFTSQNPIELSATVPSPKNGLHHYEEMFLQAVAHKEKSGSGSL